MPPNYREGSGGNKNICIFNIFISVVLVYIHMHMGSLPYEGRLRELSLFRLKERIISVNLFTVLQYVKGGYKENGNSFFTRSHMEKRRDNRYKLLPGEILSGNKRTIFHSGSNQPLEQCL